jgi:uncharacterized protein YfaS (alpha-2-macroglobulin family)
MNDSTPVSCQSRKRRGDKWFWLALCFLILNGWAVWKVAGPPGFFRGGRTETASAVKEPLKLNQVSLAAYDARGRYAVLKLDFSQPVSSIAAGRFISVFRDEAGRDKIGIEMVGDIRSRTLLVKAFDVASGETLALTLEQGLPSVSGGHLVLEAQRASVVINNGFEPRSLEVECPAFEPLSLSVAFGKRVDVTGADTLITVEPPVKIDVAPDYIGCKLTGEFQPGRAYAVTFKRGLKAEDGTTLAKEVTRQAVFGDRDPAVSLAHEGNYLSPGGALNVPVTAVNVRQALVSLQRVCPGNVVYFTNQRHEFDPYGHEGLADPAVTNTVVFPDTPNRENKQVLNLRSLAGADPRGVYHLSVAYKIPHDEYDSSRRVDRLVVVTDLGISAKVAKDGVWAWVNSLRSAQPATNTEIVLYARNNRELARGRTDAQGLVFLPCAAGALPELAPTLVTATRDGDNSFLPLSEPVRLEGTEGAPYVGKVPEAFVFADRGVYRPGEALHAKALVRDRDFAPPAPFPALFRIVKPDGKVFRDIPVTLDGLGSAECSVALPAYLPTGSYRIQLVMPGTFTELGEATLAVEDFVPPQIAVALSNLPVRIAAATSFPFHVSARHLFGRPAADLPVVAEAVFGDVGFKPAGWDGYVFGDPEKGALRKESSLGESRLDGNGRQMFTVPGLVSARPAACVKATVSATVRDSGGRPATATATTLLDAYPFYLGLKPDREGGHVKVGDTVTLAVAVVNPDGSRCAGDRQLEITVEHVEWVSVMKRNNGHYTWQSERVKSRIGAPVQVVVKDGSGTGVFTPGRAGEAVVTVRDPASGASSSMVFFSAAGDAEWVDWARDKPASVALSLDRPHYAPGDRAKLAVRAPFTGPALLTVESDRVLETRLVNLKANTAEFEIEVKPGYGPNVYCVLSLIRPAVAENVWTAHRAVGSVPLRVVEPGHRLSIQLQAPSGIRPQSRLPVTVCVKDEGGRPYADAGVVVMAVDEGICMLTDLALPDPLDYFLRQREAGVSLFDLYGKLMPVCEDASDATVSHTGGGMGEPLAKRLNPIKASRFKPVALWASGVTTDSRGEASVTLDVPEFTGELRLTAVAFGRTVFGALKQPVTVKRPLVVQAGLPRFLAPGDACRMALTIFNETGGDMEPVWRIACTGALATASPSGKLQLKAGGSVTIPVMLTAGRQPGRAACTVEVSAGAERYEETFELAVRPVLAAESRVITGVIEPGGEARITAPEGWLAGTESYDIWASGKPDIQLGGSLEWLLRYPYGCCEQTVSTCFPLLYVADLATRIRPGGLGDVDVSQWISAGVIRLLTMQRESGGFALWPDSRREELWAGLYAVHFLIEAKKSGYAVPEDRLSAALDYLKDQLPRAGVADRAYLCHVLALAGRAERGWTARLLENAAELPVSGRAHLAAALLADGKPREAVTLLQAIDLPGGSQPVAAGDSRIRSLALLLSAWLDIDPAHAIVPRLVHELQGLRIARHGGWGNTQDNALALMALGKYARVTKPQQAACSGELVASGAKVGSFKAGEELRWRSKGPGMARELKLSNQGPGRCWYGGRVEGVPVADEAADCDRGISIRRTFLDASGAALDVRRLAQGSLIVVKLSVDTRGETVNNLVVEDLLPAGWEVENPDLATSKVLPWVSADTRWCVHRELRDDRVLLFTGSVAGVAEFYYTVRAVTPGIFSLPSVRAEAMYQPDVFSLNGKGRVEVSE